MEKYFTKQLLTLAVFVQFLDVLVGTLELLDHLRVLGLEELSLSVVGGVAVVEILLVLQHQFLSASVLVPSAEQPHDVSVGNIRPLLPPRGGQLVEDNPAVDGQTPGRRTTLM